jgi:glutamate dehydrogenase
MPFLVDSVMAELTERGLATRLVVHPILAVTRDKTGKLNGPSAEAGKGKDETRESFIHIHVARVDDAARRGEIVQGLEQVLAEVRRAVADWRPMIRRIGDVIQDLKANPPPVPVDDIAEAIQFLEWVAADNFTLLGVRDYTLDGKEDLKPVLESGLGVLRGGDVPVLTRGGKAVSITPQLRAFFDEPKTLIVTKANAKSRVHRRVYLDYIGVKRFDEDGDPSGEFRIVGLFTSTVYIRSIRSIPFLRRKVDAVLTRAGFSPETHSGKAMVNVLETYPRDELFQIDEDTLYHFALSILQLEERPRVRVLARRDRFDRFVSVLVYVPRERYSGQVRAQIGEYLAVAFQGHVSAYYPYIQDAPLTRVHFIIGRDSGPTPDPDRATLEEKVSAIVRTWTDEFAETRSRTVTATPMRRRWRSRTSATSKLFRRTGRSASTSMRAPRTASPASGSRSGAMLGRSRCRSACRCWRTWASASSTSGPSRSAAKIMRSMHGCTTWCWSVPMAPRPIWRS